MLFDVQLDALTCLRNAFAAGRGSEYSFVFLPLAFQFHIAFSFSLPACCRSMLTSGIPAWYHGILHNHLPRYLSRDSCSSMIKSTIRIIALHTIYCSRSPSRFIVISAPCAGTRTATSGCVLPAPALL